jgi:hypothetical protein
MDRLLSMANRRGVIITYEYGRGGRFDPIPMGERRQSAAEIEAHLESKGYGFRRSVVDLQFGQPFKTIDDIHAFLDSYRVDAADFGLSDISCDDALAPDEGGFDLERMVFSDEDRIIRTKRYDYPYYLPRSLRVAIFVVVV